MPSFPTSVFSAASKTSGQTIQPAHVNDLQDEVTAIEGALINGTAPVHASSLTVTGGALLNALPYTFPSSGGSTGHVLTIVSTSGSTMGMEWRAAAVTVPEAVRVELDAVQQIASGSSVGVNWTNQIFLTNSSMHSTVVNPDRLTPQSTGIYLINAAVSYRAAGTAFELYVKDSSNTTLIKATSSGSRLMNVTGVKRFDALGGYIRMAAYSGGTTNSLALAETFLSVVKL